MNSITETETTQEYISFQTPAYLSFVEHLQEKMRNSDDIFSDEYKFYQKLFNEITTDVEIDINRDAQEYQEDKDKVQKQLQPFKDFKKELL